MLANHNLLNFKHGVFTVSECILQSMLTSKFYLERILNSLNTMYSGR